MNEANNIPTSVFPVKAFIIGIAAQALLWILWYAVSRIEGWSVLIYLILVTLVFVIMPMVWFFREAEEAGVIGLYVEHGCVQGVFTFFPFMMIEDWGFMSWLIVLCLIGTLITYTVTIIQMNSAFPVNTSDSVRNKWIIIQGCFGFAVGTVVSLIIAVIIAVMSGSVKKKK